jgi:hypothetical protein
MKKLIIPVHDNSEFFSDNADYAIIDLDAKLIERIKALAVAVRDLKVYKVSDRSLRITTHLSCI